MKLVSKYTAKIMVFKKNCVLFSRLYISFKTMTETLRNSSVRKAVMAAFTVVHSTTPRRNQSVSLKVLVRWLQADCGQLSVEGIILDGAVVDQMLQRLVESTFEEYFNSVVAPYSLRQLDVKGLNIVLEVYKDGSLKKVTTEKQRIGPEERGFAVYLNSVWLEEILESW